MDGGLMKFFEGLRPEIYIHGAKLRRDKKTGKRLWSLTLINSLLPEQVTECDETILAAFIYLLTLENCAAEVMLGTVAESCGIDFFANVEDKKTTLRLEGVDLGGFRLTRDGKIAELWFQFELENSASLHAFVKEYAYTRLWAEFKPKDLFTQSEIPNPQTTLANDPAFLDAADRFASSMRTGEIDSIALSTPGMEPVVIDKAAAEKIHIAAKRKKSKDPG
jgi:hypothetical protein